MNGLTRIVLSGKPLERGRQYGKAARDRIHKSIASYRDLFAYRAGVDWAAAVRQARSYEAAIAAFSPDSLEEIRGIAEGAGAAPGDILALNARSEIMFAGGRAANLAGECTSFAVLPEAAENGHTIIGQNWDWQPFATETAVLLEVHRDGLPGYVTIAEAGHLAKVGFNAAGLGVCTNTLVSTLDDGRPGVPYHILLRALLDAETMSEAVRRLYAADRAFSANYLIAHRDGLAVNAETVPGDAGGVRIAMPENGVIAHANHFLSPDLARLDARVATHPNTLFRREIMRSALERGRPAITLNQLMRTLRSHQNHPDGICAHPDERQHRFDRRSTVVSVLADLTEGELWATAGQPCSSDYEQYGYRANLEQGLEPVGNA